MRPPGAPSVYDYGGPSSAQAGAGDLMKFDLKTLPPAVAHKPLFEKVRAGVEGIRALLDRAPEKMSLEDVKTLHAQAKELNLAIAASD